MHATGSVRIKSDSRSFRDELATTQTEHRHRAVLRSKNRAYSTAILRRVAEMPRVSFTFQHVRAHQDPYSSREAYGNDCADAGAKRIAARGTARHEAERQELRGSDTAWPVTTTAGNWNGADLYVTGDLRKAIQSHFNKRDEAHRGDVASSQSTTGRDFTEGERANPPPAGSDEERSGARFHKFWSTVTLVAKSIRAHCEKPGEGTPDGVWVFLARLISRTLLSLTLIGDHFLVANGESFNTANPDDPRLKFARAGWSPLVQGAARLVQFDATCRLCSGSPDGPTADTQEHFSKCPALAPAWSDAADAAITRALLSSTLQPMARADQGVADGARDSARQFILFPDAHFARRCGFFDGPLFTAAVKSRLGDAASQAHIASFTSHLRKSLVEAAFSIHRIREQRLQAFPV